MARRSTQSKRLPNFSSLQNVQNGNMDISVIAAVELPDQRQYQFRYDSSHANLAQVILPTGRPNGVRLEHLHVSVWRSRKRDLIQECLSVALRLIPQPLHTKHEPPTQFQDPLLQSTISIRRLVL